MLPQNVIVIGDDIVGIKNILKYYKINIIAKFNTIYEFLNRVDILKYDMILIDIDIINLKKSMNLFNLLLDKYNIPIILIGDSNIDAIQDLLELNLYGFIHKPFKVEEFYISITIAYNQFLKCQKKLKTIIINSDFKFIKDTNKLYYRDKIIKLSPNQSIFITLLIKNINTTISNEQIIYEVWGDNNIADSSLRTLVYNIRKKLPTLPIKSDSKRGYYITNM